jgi:capsid protein
MIFAGMARTPSIPETFSGLKAEATQSYELAKTAQQPGKKLTLTGAIGADADYHIQNQSDFLRMIAFVRMMERNDPIIASARRRLRDNVNVGQMTPNPLTGEPLLDEHLKGAWQEYSTDEDQFDAMGRFTFEQAADISYIRTIFDGDLFGVPEGDTGTILHLEAHRCQTPNFSKVDRGACGVQTDEKGRVVRYYLTKKSTGYGRVVQVKDVEAIEARNRDGWRNVWHCYQPDRFSLNRGITSLAPVGTAANRRDDLEFAQILQAQISACITFTEDVNDSLLLKWASEHGVEELRELPDTFMQKDDAGFEMATAAIHPGRVLRSRLGRTLKQNPAPNIAGGMFQLNDLLIEYMAMCLDLPSIVLRLDAKNANFSQFRNVLDQARATYSKHQRWFSSQYHRRVWKNWIRCRAKKDKMISTYLRNEGVLTLQQSRVLRHEWKSVGWKYPHPVDDATGDLILLSSSMQDLELYARTRYGYGAEELIKRVTDGNAKAVLAAIRKSEEIESLTGRKVDWQYFWAPPNKNGINIQLIDQPDSGTAPPAPAASEVTR